MVGKTPEARGTRAKNLRDGFNPKGLGLAGDEPEDAKDPAAAKPVVETDNAFANPKPKIMDGLVQYALTVAADGLGATQSGLGRVSALAGQFMGAANKKPDKDKKADDSLTYILMMQQLMKMMNERLEDIDRALNAIDEIRNKIENGDFDPANDADDLALLQEIDPTMTADQWNAMTPTEQQDWLDENEQQLNIDREHTIEGRQMIDDDSFNPPVTNNRFDDEKLEKATRMAEIEHGSIDRNNLTPSDRYNILYALHKIAEDQERRKSEAISSINEKTPEKKAPDFNPQAWEG
jgi:anti-sigma28 factor (negative regulator of flagellin synthesis)